MFVLTIIIFSWKYVILLIFLQLQNTHKLWPHVHETMHVSVHDFVHTSLEGYSKNESNCYFPVMLFLVFNILCFVLVSICHLKESVQLYVKSIFTRQDFNIYPNIQYMKLEKEMKKKRPAGQIYLWRLLPWITYKGMVSLLIATLRQVFLDLCTTVLWRVSVRPSTKEDLIIHFQWPQGGPLLLDNWRNLNKRGRENQLLFGFFSNCTLSLTNLHRETSKGYMQCNLMMQENSISSTKSHGEWIFSSIASMYMKAVITHVMMQHP